MDEDGDRDAAISRSLSRLSRTDPGDRGDLGEGERLGGDKELQGGDLAGRGGSFPIRESTKCNKNNYTCVSEKASYLI